MEKDTVLIIGSGATRGSGVKRDGECLPTDSGFFESEIVKRLLESRGYPLLKLLRKEIPATEYKSLSKTWNAFFTLRGLVGAGVIRLEQGIVDAFNGLGNHAWPSRYTFQRGHYEIENPMDGRYIVECAIWELRVLVHDVYDPAMLDTRSAYGKFWAGIESHISAVVNMNFDTTFDLGFGGELFYPGDEKSTEGALEIIRPHGSLGWTSANQSSSYGIWDQPGWPNNSLEATSLENTGFQREGNSGPFDFRQAMIVPQPMAKEEIVGNSSMPGLNNQVLRNQWVAFERALREAKRWVFVGFSMASGDDYLELLFRHCALEEKRVCCGVYESDFTLVEKLGELLEDRVKSVCSVPIKKELGAEKLCGWLNDTA